MQKEVSLQQMDVESERIRLHLLWFTAFALLLFSGVFVALVYLQHVELAVAMMFGLGVYVSVLLGMRMEHSAVVGTIRALLLLRSQGGSKVLAPTEVEADEPSDKA